MFFMNVFVVDCGGSDASFTWKQPPKVFYKKVFLKIHRKTPVSDCLFK